MASIDPIEDRGPFTFGEKILNLGFGTVRVGDAYGADAASVLGWVAGAGAKGVGPAW